MIYPSVAGPIALALLVSLGQAGCNTRTPDVDEAAPAPVDRGVAPATDTTSRPAPITSVDTPPAPAPAEPRPDSTTPGAAKPAAPSNPAAAGKGLKVSKAEYEGWRQYSVNCARCHGQDVLPNPVAANLLVSLGPKGPIDTAEKFRQVVSEGRPERGMPGFKNLLTPQQIDAIYAYVKGRAEGRLPPGRPDRPGA
jgi:mono/diheme cytochrome c family protein